MTILRYFDKIPNMQNSHTVSTKYLRDNLAEILERVAIGGEEFVVEKFGKARVKLVPANPKKSNNFFFQLGNTDTDNFC